MVSRIDDQAFLLLGHLTSGRGGKTIVPPPIGDLNLNRKNEKKVASCKDGFD